MQSPRKHFKTVDEYIASFPEEIAEQLKTIRKIVKKHAPDAIEIISYNIPAYKLNGRIMIYFAGFHDHISIYPFSSSIGLTKSEVAKHRTGKGTLQFPLNKKLPLTFIQKIVKNKVKENKKGKMNSKI